ncbi:8403_t:CDS:2 [Cetraspora pellucida]|uniref:8403_t:CDS:1 n=1 Tax=Cetraspora pellucida TaxID=1433469 RepID=A0ACA9ML04_9GLOM|nr:8403_t:CDS:2 [Cetraspora pellucida]
MQTFRILKDSYLDETTTAIWHIFISQLDQKITKAWMMARISFEVIKNPFIKDMFKEFLHAYNTSLRTTLSGRLLDEEIAHVNHAIDNDIDKADHLTLDAYIHIDIDIILNYIISFEEWISLAQFILIFNKTGPLMSFNSILVLKMGFKPLAILRKLNYIMS